MASASYYRREAARCRELAAGAPDSEMAKGWRSIAADYETLAEALEASPGAAQFQPAPMQHQPMQQQQARTKPDDEAS